MSRADDCCWRCSTCGELTCAHLTCNNRDFWADPVRELCGWCAREADGKAVPA